MDPTSPDSDSTSDLFFDAPDSLQEDNEQQPQEETLTPLTSPAPSKPIKTLHVDEPPPDLSPDPPPLPSLRRRRSSSRSTITRSISGPSGSFYRERRSKLLNELRDENPPVTEAPEATTSTIPSCQIDTPQDGGVEAPDGSLLFSLAEFVIKSIFFQLNLLFNCFALPVRVLYFSFLMVTDPFGVMKAGRNVVKEGFLWVWSCFMKRFSPLVLDRLGEQGVGKLVGRVALGCFWSAYVGFILLGIFVTAFLGGSLLMRSVVKEPLQMVRELNFDYTRPSPNALVPIDSRGVGCDFYWSGKHAIGKQLDGRVVPRNHKLNLVISLTLPESDYNRKLGMFQVRAEFLSANGEITHSSSKPCMLQFKSYPIRFLETFVKSGTLLAGFVSESQILKIKMAGFIEGTEPTACVRIILEQRAEYSPGAGIPEIYSASLKLESSLPFLKKIIWNWRWTIFIWVGMMVFFLELVIVLVCCRPVILPRTRVNSETDIRIQ